MLGNTMAVNAMDWIGQRIEFVRKMLVLWIGAALNTLDGFFPRPSVNSGDFFVFVINAP